MADGSHPGPIDLQTDVVYRVMLSNALRLVKPFLSQIEEFDVVFS